MPTIYLIRHGQASFGQENYDQLSTVGEQQAAVLGNSWRQRLSGFDAIAMGSMHRHRQTAELCLSAMRHDLTQLNPLVDAGWDEYDHQDILAQLRPELATAESTQQFVAQQENPKQAFEAMFNAAIDRWIAGQNNADYRETWRDFHSRVHAALNELIYQCQDKKHIAVFTSGGPISLLSQAILGVPEGNIMQLNWTLVNCGVTKIVVTRSRRFIATLSQHVHFEGQHQNLITYR